MTIRHVVMWKLATEDPAERAEQIERMSQKLRGLVGVVPSLASLTVGPDVVGGGNWDVCLVTDFADRAGLDEYQVHPSHQEVAAYVRSVVSERAAVDFEI